MAFLTVQKFHALEAENEKLRAELEAAQKPKTPLATGITEDAKLHNRQELAKLGLPASTDVDSLPNETPATPTAAISESKAARCARIARSFRHLGQQQARGLLALHRDDFHITMHNPERPTERLRRPMDARTARAAIQPNLQ